MRIRGVLHDSSAKASPEYFKRAASNPATDYDEHIHAHHVLKNMSHAVSLSLLIQFQCHDLLLVSKI